MNNTSILSVCTVQHRSDPYCSDCTHKTIHECTEKTKCGAKCDVLDDSDLYICPIDTVDMVHACPHCPHFEPHIKQIKCVPKLSENGWDFRQCPDCVKRPSKEDIVFNLFKDLDAMKKWEKLTTSYMGAISQEKEINENNGYMNIKDANNFTLFEYSFLIPISLHNKEDECLRYINERVVKIRRMCLHEAVALYNEGYSVNIARPTINFTRNARDNNIYLHIVYPSKIVKTIIHHSESIHNMFLSPLTTIQDKQPSSKLRKLSI